MNYRELDLSSLDLDTPSSLNNSYYFSKFTNENIILNLDTCIFNKKIELLKRGDSYVLLDFDNNEMINFFNKLEDSTCELILKKSQEWFENNVTLEDIKDSFNTNIKNNQVKFKLNSDVKENTFILNDNVNHVDEFNNKYINNELIPKIKLLGIKFNSNNFYLVLELLEVTEHKVEELNHLDENKEINLEKNLNMQNVNVENVIEDNNDGINKESLENSSDDYLESQETNDNNDNNNDNLEKTNEKSTTLEENENTENTENITLEDNEDTENITLEEKKDNENTENAENITLEEKEIKEITELENLNNNENKYVDETKNILKLNENRLLFYKLYVLFMEQIKTHQVDSILGKLEELNINYEKFIDFLNNEKENYLSEEKFNL